MSRDWLPDHLRFAIGAASVSLWCWDIDTDQLKMDREGFSLWGLEPQAAVSFEELSSHIHPADQNRVRAAFMATHSVSGLYEADFRIMLGEEIRWVAARGKGSDEGLQDRSKFGVFIDVTQRKQIEEANELLAGEMSHRVLNLLAIATALTTMTGKTAKTVEEMTEQLVDRLMALGRAHSIVRPLPHHEGRAALFGDLLAILLAPYDHGGAFAGRIKISVPRMGVGETAAMALAMIFHELATNSLKHGALSLSSGVLNITSTSIDDEVVIVWAETGGPPISEPPNRQGFGSKILSRSVERQLQGSLRLDWQPAGLVVTLRVSRLQLKK